MSASVRQNLLQKIDENREKAVSFLQEMIAIPSVTGDEAKIQKFWPTTWRRSASMSTSGKRIGRS